MIYRIKVKGHIGNLVQTIFENFNLELNPLGYSILTGSIEDQAMLHGILNQIYYLGYEVISVFQEEENNEEH